MIHISGLSNKYGETKILSDISFSISKGEILGVMGKNGAGKTTLIKSILREVDFSGTIDMPSLLINKNNTIDYENIYFVRDTPHIYEYLTGPEYIQFVLRVTNKKLPPDSRIFEVLETFGIEPDHFSQLLKEYSFGMKRKVVLGAGFLMMPKLMILDEPTIGLDVSSVIILKKLIFSAAKKGMTFLVTSHEPTLVSELCHSLLILNNTKMVYYNKDFKTESEPLDQLYMKLIGENLNDKITAILG